MADRDEIIQVINEIGAAVDGEGEVTEIQSADQIGDYNVTLPGIRRDGQGNFMGYVVANMSLFMGFLQSGLTTIQNAWSAWFGTNDQTGVQGQWEILRTNVQTATTAANTAAEDAETATEAADAATEAAEAATDGAENVDASVNGYVITVTDRDGDTHQINLKPDIDAKLDKISEEDFDEIFDSEATEAYKGSYNLVTDLNLTLSATRAQIATALGTAISGEENGDYAYVMIPFDASRPVYIEHVERYSYNGTAWGFDYVYNRNILDATGDGIFDISAYHADGGALVRYADLAAALGTNGANIPESEQRGGMTVRFVSGVTGEYEQWRLLTDTFNTTVSNWQSMNVDKEPTAGSKNLVESDGIEKQLTKLKESVDYYETEIININSTYNRSSNEWWTPQLTTNIVAGERYIIEYTNLSLVPSRFYTSANGGTTELQNLRPYLSIGSGLSEFIATSNATYLRVFNSTAYSGTIKIYHIQGSSHEIDEIREDVVVEEKQIVKIKDLLEVNESELVSINSSYDVTNNWWTPQLTNNIITGNRYIIEYTNLNKVPNTFVTAIDNGATPKQNLRSYVSVGSGRSEFIATSDATNLRVWDSGNYTGTIKIYKEIYTSNTVSSIDNRVSSIDNRVSEVEKILSTIDILKKPILSNWNFIKIDIKANVVYRFKYEGISSSCIFNAYLVESTDGVNLQDIIQATVTRDGEVQFTANTNANFLKIYTNSQSTVTVTLSEIVENSIEYLYEKIDSKTSDLLIAKKFKGKKILCLGDSFTYLAYYLKYLSDVTGCIVTSRGVNGGHIGTFVGDAYTNPPAGVNGHNDSYDVGENVPQVFNSELLDEYDIVTVMGGSNDYGSNFSLGSIEDGVDSGTVYGHVKKVIDKILTLKPHIKIYFCTQPYRCPNPSFHNGLGGYMPNNAGVTLEQTMEAVKKCAEYYGIPVCDFYHNGGWNSYNNKETNPGQGSYPYGPFMDNIYTVDGLHPRDGNGNGADMLGTYFGNFINLH